jgi:hemerythrin-like metal-binding protein
MHAFQWDHRFVVGLESIDSQHRHLVDLVNQVGDLLLAGQADEERLLPIFHQLADYARFHFADEERLMEEIGMDPRHAESHKRHHGEFLKQVLQMWNNRANVTEPVASLHDFLAAWLTVHILGEDQVMGRIIERIRAGEAPDRAYDAEVSDRDNSVTALLDALHSLYHLLSEQNRDLAAANERLEEKVQARTRDLLRAEKLASVGRLAAGVAHEINNPVAFVQSNLGSLKGYADDLFGLIEVYETGDRAATEQARQAADIDFLRADMSDLLAESLSGLERVSHIVRHLKDFSHVDQAELQDSDLNTDLENSLQVAWHELQGRVEVVRDYGDLPAVRCVPAQINQVFFNLIVNAAQAIEGKGSLTLSTRAVDGQIEVAIADTGKGMSPEVVQRIFDPFYTTRPVGKGAGLGLSEAYDIVVKHGGRIDVESEPGRGSTFRIRLPVAGA